jgi:hypothetical protein
MIKRWRQPVCATAGALIHADDIHSRSHSLLGYPQHVFGIARALEPVYENDGQCGPSISLPMTVAKHLDSGFNLDQSLFRRGERKLAWQQKAGDGLNVAATKETPGPKFDVTLQV